jgi:hypothetical protein
MQMSRYRRWKSVDGCEIVQSRAKQRSSSQSKKRARFSPGQTKSDERWWWAFRRVATSYFALRLRWRGCRSEDCAAVSWTCIRGNGDISDWCAWYPDSLMRCYKSVRGRSVREREVEVGSKLYKRVWADLVEPVGEVLVKKGVVDGRTERAREQERDGERV